MQVEKSGDCPAALPDDAHFYLTKVKSASRSHWIVSELETIDSNVLLVRGRITTVLANQLGRACDAMQRVLKRSLELCL